MSNTQDIRWEQRFSNYKKALKKLFEAIHYIDQNMDGDETNMINDSDKEVLEEIIKEGLIQRFEYTYEMAWNVMKDYAFYQGVSNIAGSRDAIRYAFAANLIEDGERWMEMIKSRVKTSHTYNEATANEVYLKIIEDYYPAFMQFQKVMDFKKSSE